MIKKIGLVLACVASLLAGCGGPEQVELPEEPISWQDEGLETLARWLTSLPEGGVRPGDLSHITSLELDGGRLATLNWVAIPEGYEIGGEAQPTLPELSTLADLIHFPSLASFSIRGCAVDALPPEEAGKRLETLEIASARLTDIGAVAGWSGLRAFSAADNPLENPAAAFAATQLEELNLSGTGLDSLAGVEGMDKLTVLDIADNPLEDLSPLEGMTGLVKLNAAGLIGAPEGIRALANLEGLVRLDMGGNGWSDISPLASLPSLRELYAPGNQISDTAPLREMGELRTLDLGNNVLTHLEDIAFLENLEHLDVAGNRIGEIGPICGLPNLVWLDVMDNRIIDYRPAEALTSLRYLAASQPEKGTITQTSFYDSEFLKGYAELEFLHMKGVFNLYGAVELPKLRRIVAETEHFSEPTLARWITGMEELEWVVWNGEVYTPERAREVVAAEAAGAARTLLETDVMIAAGHTTLADGSVVDVRLVLADASFSEYDGNWQGAWEGTCSLQVLFADDTVVMTPLEIRGAGGYREYPPYKLYFSDYNNDGNPDFAWGDWHGTNYREYTIYSILPGGTVEELPCDVQPVHSYPPHQHNWQFCRTGPTSFTTICYAATYIPSDEESESWRGYFEESGRSSYDFIEWFYEWQDGEFQLVRTYPASREEWEAKYAESLETYR